MKVKCPGCANVIRFPDDEVPKKLSCPKCGKGIRLSVARSTSAEAASSGAAELPAPPPRRITATRQVEPRSAADEWELPEDDANDPWDFGEFQQRSEAVVPWDDKSKVPPFVPRLNLLVKIHYWIAKVCVWGACIAGVVHGFLFVYASDDFHIGYIFGATVVVLMYAVVGGLYALMLFFAAQFILMFLSIEEHARKIAKSLQDPPRAVM